MTLNELKSKGITAICTRHVTGARNTRYAFPPSPFKASSSTSGKLDAPRQIVKVKKQMVTLLALERLLLKCRSKITPVNET